MRLARIGEQGIRIHVRISRIGRTVRGELDMGDPQEASDTRRVDGLSCGEVVEALSLTAALAIDPSASLLSKKTDDEPGNPPQLGPTLAHPQQVSPNDGVGSPTPPAKSSSSSVRLEPFARMLLTTDQKPGLWIGPSLGVRLVAGRLLLGMDGFGLFPSTSAYGLKNARLTGVGVAACPLLKLTDAWEVAPCLGAKGAVLHVAGADVAYTTTANRSWWALTAGVVSLARIWEEVRLELSAGIAVPLIQRSFALRAPDREVVTSPDIACEAGLGISQRF